MVRRPDDSTALAATTVGLHFQGRGREVVADDNGRWIFGERPVGRRRLRAGVTHGTASSVPSLLVHAEAHDALSALADKMKGRIALVYIDPPYNTGQDFPTYKDRATHQVWLAALEERVRASLPLLAPGALFVVQVNVDEQAYLKVLLDECFGRDRFVGQIAWQRSPDRTVLGQGATLMGDQVEYIMLYRNGDAPLAVPRPQKRGPLPDKTLATYARELVPSARTHPIATFDGASGPVRIVAHQGFSLTPVPQRRLLEESRTGALSARFPQLMRLTNQQAESTFQQRLLSHMPEFGLLYRAEYVQSRGKHAGPRVRYYLNGQVVLWLKDVAVLDEGRPIRISDLNNFWSAEELPVTGIAGEGGVTLRRGKKPEALLTRIVNSFAPPGGWVLDFFAGSGTTGAIAQRTGRPWILVEHAATHVELCRTRLGRELAHTGGGFQEASVDIVPSDD